MCIGLREGGRVVGWGLSAMMSMRRRWRVFVVKKVAADVSLSLNLDW